MTPFFFGPPERRLFGTFHQPQRPSKDGVAVLVCNPLGQEYVRCHRMLRTLADRLERAGRSCLRFDYYGTGDSEGEDEENLLSHWERDIAIADDELRQRSRASRIVWLGIRLGAVAALSAAERAAPPPVGLVLWEPIGSGAAYLDYLRDAHRHALETSYTLPQREGAHDLTREILGFGASAAMLREIEAVALRGDVASRPATWVMPPESDRRGFLASPPSSTEPVLLRHAFEFNSEEALNTALVPAEAVKTLFERIEAIA